MNIAPEIEALIRQCPKSDSGFRGESATFAGLL